MLSVGGRITIHESRITRMTFGAHVSIRGALHLAVDRAVAIGCECLQIFVSSPRQWRDTQAPKNTDSSLLVNHQPGGPRPPVPHAPYLVNIDANHRDYHHPPPIARPPMLCCP